MQAVAFLMLAPVASQAGSCLAPVRPFVPSDSQAARDYADIIRRDFEIKQAVPKAFAAAYMWVLHVVNSLGKLKIDVCVCVCARARNSGFFKTVGGLLVRAYPTRSHCTQTKSIEI